MPLPPPSPSTSAPLLPQQGLLMLRFLLCRTLVLEATTHIYSVAVSVCSSVSWVALPPPCLSPHPLPLSPWLLVQFPLYQLFCVVNASSPSFLFAASLTLSLSVCVFRGCAINFFHPSPARCPSSPHFPFRSTALLLLLLLCIAFPPLPFAAQILL